MRMQTFMKGKFTLVDAKFCIILQSWMQNSTLIDMFQQNEILFCILYSTQKSDTDTVVGLGNIF